MPEVNNICDDKDLMFIVVSGLRYCMGRNSYAPLIACEVIKGYWHQIDGFHRDLIRKDVKEYVNRMITNAAIGPFAFTDMNKDMWIELLSWIEANP